MAILLSYVIVAKALQMMKNGYANVNLIVGGNIINIFFSLIVTEN